jgi:hypothetical protein
MKKCSLLISLFALFFSFTGSSQSTDNDKIEAKNIYTICSPVAELWLKELDKTGYSYLNKLKLSDLVKTQMTEKLEAELQNIIINNEKTFGGVLERKFTGAHIWLHDSLLTYIPVFNKRLAWMGKSKAPDGFYNIEPGYMGLEKSSDMFKSFPKGDYIILMYEALPKNKPKAEEMIILWRESKDIWQVVSYEIADDI